MVAVLSILLLSHFALSASVATPIVTLDNAKFTGLTFGFVDQFLGIPFAQPPVGDLRFRLPQPIKPYTGDRLTMAFGPSCPQQYIKPPTKVSSEITDRINNTFVTSDSEDCLTINVIRPVTASANSKLPVVIWIYGGGWQVGGTSPYDGPPIVSRSMVLGKPIIFVSMNYRLTGFGFLASKEVKAAGVSNIGLHDQREALRWVQKYIGAFGGDPTKVTIWGLSAGAISISLHMVANNGNAEGLFRAAFMQSGSPWSLGDVTNGQVYYDRVVTATGCSGSSDTLDCLRKLPYATLKAAIDRSPNIFDYQSLRVAWPPRVDGTFITDNPHKLVQQGVVAKVPFVSGVCDDEGTMFSFGNLNVTTESQFRGYIQGTFWPGTSNSDVERLATLYTADITQGSPYDTGIFNALTPQYKRLASFQGDAAFQAPRRFFLKNQSGKQNTWAYLSKRLKGQPWTGSAHGTDVLNMYGGGELADYLINFVVDLDPNGSGRPQWPKYTTSNPQMLTFWDGVVPTTLTPDSFRQEGIDFITQMNLAHPL